MRHLENQGEKEQKMNNLNITIAEADMIISKFLPSTAAMRISWEKFKDADKEAYLNQAIAKISSFKIKKSIHPDILKSVIALEACTTSEFTDEIDQRKILQAAGVTSYSVTGLSESFETSETKNDKKLISETAEKLLKPYLIGMVNIT